MTDAMPMTEPGSRASVALMFNRAVALMSLSRIREAGCGSGRTRSPGFPDRDLPIAACMVAIGLVARSDREKGAPSPWGALVFLDRAGGFVVSQGKRRKDPGAEVMTSTLAASFRALFTTITVVAVLAVVGTSCLLWYTGYGLVPALGLLIGGLILVVAAFGLVAIQIENNELLAVIAEALTDPAAARAPEAALLRPQAGAEPLLLRPAPEPAPAARGRVEPAAAAAPRGRVEPVLSARRG